MGVSLQPTRKESQTTRAASVQRHGIDDRRPSGVMTTFFVKGSSACSDFCFGEVWEGIGVRTLRTLSGANRVLDGGGF